MVPQIGLIEKLRADIVARITRSLPATWPCRRSEASMLCGEDEFVVQLAVWDRLTQRIFCLFRIVARINRLSPDRQ